MAEFFLQKFVIFNVKTDSILVEKWGILEVAWTCDWNNLLDLGCQNIIRFGIFKLLNNEESFGESFSFPFSAKCFNKNFKCLY